MYVMVCTQTVFIVCFSLQNIHVFQDINFRLLVSYVRGIIVDVECSLAFIGILLLTIYR